MPKVATRVLISESDYTAEMEKSQIPKLRLLAVDSNKFVDMQDFYGLFPGEKGKKLRSDGKAYVAIYNTKNRMSEVSTEQLEERKTVAEHFAKCARSVCEKMKNKKNNDGSDTNSNVLIDYIQLEGGKPGFGENKMLSKLGLK